MRVCLRQPQDGMLAVQPRVAQRGMQTPHAVQQDSPWVMGCWLEISPLEISECCVWAWPPSRFLRFVAMFLSCVQ